MAEVAFENVSKVFQDGTAAVDDLTLHIDDGEFMVLVGPSGCGKTTTLRMLAGLEEATSGVIRIGERKINDLEPRKRDIAMVFQSYALYPNLTVAQNLGFALKMRRMPRAEIRQRVEAIARVLDLGELLGRKPAALSGGQRQRVAMGRAIIREPQAFLMDEPLSNLDAALRVQMRAEIARIQRDVGATTIYVTHDQVEAMTMGDRIAVMRKGLLQQLGPPAEIYDRPANLFVASFIGSPAVNLLEALVEEDGDGIAVRVGQQRLGVSPETLREAPALRSYVNQLVGVGIRPEHLHDTGTANPPTTACLTGHVVTSEVLGAEVLVHLEVDANRVTASQVIEVAQDLDAAEASRIAHERRSGRALVIARCSRDTRATVGASLTVAVAAEGLLFFDLSTGAAIRG